MEVAPFFVDFHLFLSIFTIFYRFSQFTHFCRDLHFVAIYAHFPQFFFGQNSLLRKITRFLHVCCSVVEKDLLFFSCIFCAHHPYFVLRIPPQRICPPSLFHVSQADCIIEFYGFGAHHELDINRGYLEITVGKSFYRVLKF